MTIVKMLQFVVGTGLLLIGMFILAVQVFGVFKFKYVLNRMHAAAMGDTLGIGASLLGLIVLEGFTFTSLKFLLVIVFLWCASPVASHLIARLESVMGTRLKKNCEMTEEVLQKIKELEEE